MAERGLKKTGRPKLIVECENITTLMGVANVINRSCLNAKILMEYDIVEYGEGNRKNERMDDKKESCM